MPYKAYQRGDGWVVTKRGEPHGHVFGTHSNLADAEAQITAINMSEHGLGRKTKKHKAR